MVPKLSANPVQGLLLHVKLLLTLVQVITSGPVSSLPGRLSPWSLTRGHLIVPCTHMAQFRSVAMWFIQQGTICLRPLRPTFSCYLLISSPSA